MKCHQTEQSTAGCSAAGYTYPKGRLLPSCSGLRNFAGFQIAKTSANKRFLICLLSQLIVNIDYHLTLRCKGSELF